MERKYVPGSNRKGRNIGCVIGEHYVKASFEDHILGRINQKIDPACCIPYGAFRTTINYEVRRIKSLMYD